MQKLAIRGGRAVSIGELLAAGGDGRVHAVVGQPALAVKLLHRADEDDGRRLRALVSIPLDHWHRDGDRGLSIAWPLAVIEDRSGRARGVLMPRVPGVTQTLSAMAKTTQAASPARVSMAEALADRFERLLSAGLVLPDPSPANALVSPAGALTLIDCDGVLPPGHTPHRPPRATLGYTAPETLRDAHRRDRRTSRFGLAVMIVELLTGAHPFVGRPRRLSDDEAEDWTLDSAVLRGSTRFDPRCRIRLPAGAVPPSVLAEPLHRLARRALLDGHLDPDVRPDAREWAGALQAHGRTGLRCDRGHFHDAAAGAGCPWCRLSHDPRSRRPTLSAPTLRERALRLRELILGG